MCSIALIQVLLQALCKPKKLLFPQYWDTTDLLKEWIRVGKKDCMYTTFEVKKRLFYKAIEFNRKYCFCHIEDEFVAQDKKLLKQCTNVQKWVQNYCTVVPILK